MAISKRISGMTLIEVMIVVAIVSLLAGIAVPAYLETVSSSRRTDAMTTLMRFSNQQEVFFSNNNFYTAALGLATTSDEGYYVISFPAVTAATYIIQATPAAGSSQVGDGAFRITSDGQRLWDKDDNGSFGHEWGDH